MNISSWLPAGLHVPIAHRTGSAILSSPRFLLREWIRRRHEPVTAERDHAACVNDRSNRVHPFGALLANKWNIQFGDIGICVRPQGLEVCDYIKFPEPG